MEPCRRGGPTVAAPPSRRTRLRGRCLGLRGAAVDVSHHGAVDEVAKEPAREQLEMRDKAPQEFAEVKGILEAYGLDPEESAKVTAALQARPEAMVDFMMRFELGLEQPEPGGAWKSALTIALAYVLGGLVPLVPYFVLDDARRDLKKRSGA